ncbi:hypothetical protein MPDQ_001587 [Monascus purpureus]|uniref:IgE-binding protein n=1 Tax=Monascus purpureus TaxID=5098 RepID=A0A507QMA6_MONPU|nr:hypothetical protein MPDQ_001587 [Monascus purpureus]
MQLISSLAAAAALLGASVQAQSDSIVLGGLMSLRSLSPIHFGQVNAANGKFWIWGPGPKTYCPPQAGNCPTGNDTVISLSNDTGRASLYTLVPGGQNIYVAPDASLSFTEPHQEGVFPPGSILDGFSFTPAQHQDGVSLVNYNGNGSTGFTACPASGDYPWQIFAAVPSKSFSSECLPFGIQGGKVTSSPDVWEYI